MATYSVTDGQTQNFTFISQTPNDVEDINASGAATIQIGSNPDERRGQYGAQVNLNLAPNAKTTLGYRALDHNSLTVNGDTTTSVIVTDPANSLSTSGVGFPQAVINPDVIGTGGFGLDAGASLEFGRSVADTITVSLGGNYSFGPAKLILDTPNAFKGAVNFNDGQLVLKGLGQATDYALANGVLTIYGGAADQPIDALRLTDKSPEGTGLSLILDPEGSIQVAEQGTPIAQKLPSGTALTQHVTPVVTNPPTGQQTTPDNPPVTTQPETPDNPPATVADGDSGQQMPCGVQPYTGPVAGLLQEIVNITTKNLNILAHVPGMFIHSGSGNDAIQASSGRNVLDGGTGSNFLTGGGGTDTFFVDARGAAADIWSSVVNFHSGSDATVWGISAAAGAQWADGQGAAGAQGLTLHAGKNGHTASITLAGFSTGDLASGRVSAQYGSDPASGSNFLHLHAV